MSSSCTWRETNSDFMEKPKTSATTQAVAKTQPQQAAVAKRDATAFLESPAVMEAVAKVIPKFLTKERLVRVAITTVMGSEKILAALQFPEGKASLLNSLMRCSQAGLEPDGQMAHLIPRGKLITVVFDYKGLIHLADLNGIKVKASLVRRNDRFSYREDDGSGQTVVEHSFDPFNDRGEIIGVYSRAAEKGKAPDYEFMSIEEVENTRRRSPAAENGPWVSDYSEMVRKTVVRRHSKRLNLDPRTRQAINGDDDVPSDIPKAKIETEFARPLFSAPAPAPESLPEHTAWGDDYAEMAKKTGEGIGPSPCEKLHALASGAGITDGQLLENFAATGLTDGSQTSLEEVPQEAIQTVINGWQAVSAAIKEAK